jgi:hypothetical protein
MQMNHRTTLGQQGLPYCTKAAAEMISDRMKKLAERGQPADRNTAVGQLATEGNLKTAGEATTRSVSLAEASEARREVSAEERQARDWLARAKEEAAEREITLGEVMNEKVMKGEVRL